MREISLVLAASISLLGCATDGDVGDDTTGDDGGPVDPPPPPPPASHPADAYRLTSDLDINATTIVPATVHQAIELMRTFETSPGEAILDLAELAGVPGVATLRAALPDFLESRLIGWIDDQLEDSPFVIAVGEIVDLADTSFGQVELGSVLDLTDGFHALDTVAVEIGGQRAELDVESPDGDTLGLTADVTTTSTGRELSIGEHRFGIKVGTAAWTALTAAIVDRFGADLETVLADAIDCPGLADTISRKCVFGQCVGHRTELEDACTGAIGYAVDKLHDQITGVDFDAVIFHAGHATGTDADRDGTFETLTGTWTADLDLGQGPRSVPATFTGAAL
jgi:hypothetical protein